MNLQDEVFQCYFDPAINEDHSEINELDSYIKEETPHLDAVNYWSSHKKYFKLREVSYFLFSIPVSSVSSERVGSSLNYTLQKRRSSLNPYKIDKMLFIKSNSDLDVESTDF